jgi:outer membrane protein assembly factor BamB
MKKINLVLLLVLGALLLSACTGGRASIVNTWAGLAADAGQAYLASGSHVYAVDVTTGKEVWRYPVETDSNIIFYANPVLTPDGQLLVGSEGNNHELVSINPETGKDNWAAPFTEAKGKWVASPLVFNDTIYAPNSDGFLYILDMNGKSVSDPIELGGALWSAPVTDGTYIYVTALDHHLHIIDPATGKTGEPIDLGGATPGSPAVGEGGVYVGSFSSNIEFVKSTGDHKVLATAANWIWGTPVLNNGALYYADLSGNLYSMDVATGSQNWDAVQPDGPIVASPLVTGDTIYVVTEAGTLLALDRDAKVVWEKTVGGKLYTNPVLSGDIILVAPYKADFALAAYDAAGKQAWTFTPEK